jgi:PAS domain S-box-containing protein
MVWMPEAKGLAEQSRFNKPLYSAEGTPNCIDWSRLLLDAFEEAVALVDRQGHILAANKAWNQLQCEFSWLDEENGRLLIRETEFKQACHDADAIVSGLKEVMEGARADFRHEFNMFHAGENCWFRLSARESSQGAENPVLISLRNITTQRQAEEDLRETRSLFDCLIESTGDSFFLYDSMGRFIMHNTAGMELLGREGESLVGKTIEEVFPPGEAHMIRAQNDLVLATQQTLNYEISLNTPKGERVAWVQKRLYRNQQDKPVGVIGIVRDVTEHKNSEENLKRSEHHFRALIERSADVVMLVGADEVIRYISPPAQQFCGFSSDELLGTNVFFWIHPEDTQLAQIKFRELCKTPGDLIIAECRYLCKSGEWKWVEVTASNQLDDASVQAVVINARDISERKKSEQTLRRFEAIVESSVDGIFSLDLDGKITSWNPAAQKMFGGSGSDMLGRDFKALCLENKVKGCSGFNARMLRGKGVEMVCNAPDGTRMELSLSFSPILSPNHLHCGFAVIARDITERRRLEREVLEIADFEKHRIGQDLHDDLCQHLVGISIIGNLLHVELARNGAKQAEDAKQITEMIRAAVDHARILAKGLSPLNIAEGEIMAGLKVLASNTEQLFRFPCFFECDSPVHIEDTEIATQFYRIAQEALHNAVKHSQGTQAVLRLRIEGKAVVITISDDGLGLPEFKKPGTGGGLGMHTMHYRARIIGATLEITRNLRGGTDVTCRLPIPEG